MEIIKTEKLEKIYSDNGVPVRALNGIDLKIKTGDFAVIAGPSGSGKTTLLNLLGALDKPTKGTVLFENEDISLKSKNQLALLRLQKIGFVFQAYNLLPVLSAMENIEFTMVLRGISEKVRREKVLRVMEDLGIKELAHKRPNEMSGGQQQRVAVARAIVNNPSVILADEPTANLDSKNGANLLDMMLKMNQEKNITFVFSSHDNLVIERARKLIIMKDGLIESEKLR